MAPCWDVYIWMDEGTAAIYEFIEHFVDFAKADPRLTSFLRVYVEHAGSACERSDAAELSSTGYGDLASIYLPAHDYYGAILTATAEGSLTLGLRIDDPEQNPEVEIQAAKLLVLLQTRYDARDGRAGVELAPASSRNEWDDDSQVLLRTSIGRADSPDEVIPGVVRR